MNNNIARTILSIILKAIIMGGIMFLFYYYDDKTELKKALLKASVIGLLFGGITTWTENWRLKKNSKNKTDS